MAETRAVTLRAVVYEDGDQWVAMCLEHYVMALGKNPADVLDQLRKAIVASLEISEEMGVEPFVGIPRTPQRYWDLYEAHSQSAEWMDVPGPLPAIEVRTAARELAA